MGQADRIHAGQKQISAKNSNKTIEQGNRLSSFQGGPGVNSQNDATGLQLMNNRKRVVLDADSPFSSSSPWRKTLKRRDDATRHKGEFELYGSSGVSALAREVSSDVPQYYGIPFLPVDSSTDTSNGQGDGELAWGVMDADALGDVGPRSLERRSSSSGERFQIYNFDTSGIGSSGVGLLDSSEVVQVPIRRRFNSSGNAYIDFIDSSLFAIPDGNTLSTSSPVRKTLKRRAETAGHRREWEMFNSSTVPHSKYQIPFLDVDSVGTGDLAWAFMDADESGNSGPRSLEQRSSSSGERFQLYKFDDAAATLDTNEVTQTAVRRRYGSSGNHYIDWVDSSDLSSSTSGGGIPSGYEEIDLMICSSGVPTTRTFLAKIVSSS